MRSLLLGSALALASLPALAAPQVPKGVRSAAPASSRGPSVGEPAHEAEPTLPVVLEGCVLEPGGGPAPEAVVVTSAGGRAVTDNTGSYRLEAAVPTAAEELQVTALAADGRRSASARVALARGSERARVAPIVLAAEGTCQARWQPTFGCLSGGYLPTLGNALAVFDSGGGPRLYDVGTWPYITSEARPLREWDGAYWRDIEGRMDGDAHALAVFDDGTGPALFVGGGFTHAADMPAPGIAKWDGRAWSPVGVGVGGSLPEVHALAVFDDGSGPALYAGGSFTTAGGNAASHIARWNGSSWSPLGGGVDGDVLALTVLQVGATRRLCAGGAFQNAGGKPASHVAAWDGTAWRAFGSGTQGDVRTLLAFDDGSGPALYAGGNFLQASNAAADHVARWNGERWNALGAGLTDQVLALEAYDDGTGPSLYATGYFLGTPGGSRLDGVARWDGTDWLPLDVGLGVFTGSPADGRALAVFDGGKGPELVVSANTTAFGPLQAKGFGSWNGTRWAPLGSAPGKVVEALRGFDDGTGPALYAGGEFESIGTAPARGFAKWDGTTWSEVGGGITGTLADVVAMAEFDDGSGRALYVAGQFSTIGGVSAPNIARWDGTSWSSVGGGISHYVMDLAVYDDGTGPALYACGDFTAAGGVPASDIAKWDGTSWSALGTGLPAGRADTLAVYDDGTGPALYLGGSFPSVGGTPAHDLARWDGTSWSDVGGGTDKTVHDLAVYDDGRGPALYAGGSFTQAGGIPASEVARWDGTSWEPVGIGFTKYPVLSLTAFDDGSGPALFAGGAFSFAFGGGVTQGVARWDGTSWSALGSGLIPDTYLGGVLTSVVYDEGTGPALYFGGEFFLVPDSGDARIAKWGCARPTDAVGKTRRR